VRRLSGGAAAAASPGGGGGAQGADACRLVTQSDATAALGEPAGAPSGHSTPVSSICDYASSSGGARLVVDIYHSADASTAAAQFQQNFGGIGEPVSGLGDQARASADGSLLYILKGSKFISIALLGTTKQPDVKGAVRALGTKLLGEI